MSLQPKVRSSQGCWTCRLRRKKCDEQHPVCVTCDSLEITCLYSDTKPEWMDGGEREKQASEDMKRMVKEKANERRERKWAQVITTSNTPDDDAAGLSNSMVQTMKIDSDDAQPPARAENSSTGSPSNGQAVSDTLQTTSHLTEGSVNTPVSSSASRPSQEPAAEPLGFEAFLGEFSSEQNVEKDAGLIMKFLDYVFPFLFPFYRPPLLESGRGWILMLLMNNKPLFHTALSLSGFFFAVALEIAHVGGHSTCKKANWSELQKQQQCGMQELQKEIQTLNERGVASGLKSSTRTLYSIMQTIVFEVAISHTNSWQMHLDAATVLFQQILKVHGSSVASPWRSIFKELGIDFPVLDLGDGVGGRHPLSSDQAALKFFTANLVWSDILASTTLEQPPRLRDCHTELLGGDKPEIMLSEYIGVENWVALAIADIATLDAWKKQMRAAGSLSVVILVQRAAEIEARLKGQIAVLDQCLEMKCTEMRKYWEDPSTSNPLLSFSGLDVETQVTGPAIALHTKIYAQAALAYLAITVSGFQPGLPEVQSSVAGTIHLFEQLPRAIGLRTLVWPFAVTGLLASPAQQATYKEFASNVGIMGTFGTIKDAYSIMTTVWVHRESGCIDENWDIAQAFASTGYRPLLI